MGRLRRLINKTRDSMRTQLWPRPLAAITLALFLGVLIPRLDAEYNDNLADWLKGYLFGGGADSAKSLLSSIVGSLITATSLTFSLTIVTLQLASSQFSPRLLRTFTQDRVVHYTLALFLGTFTYALTVLRTIRTPTDEREVFVPQIAVTVAFLLTLASVVGLVLFLAHLARQIRVENILRVVHAEADETLHKVTQERGAESARGGTMPEPPGNAVPLSSSTSGFLVDIDTDGLLAAACEADAIVVIDVLTGSSVVAGGPIGGTWGRLGDAVGDEAFPELQHRVGEALHTGFERTQQSDIGFGMRQITDVAVKALSPGINDPTTAVHAISHLSALLCAAVDRDLGPELLCDEQGVLRVVLARPDLAYLMEVAFTQIRRYGASEPFVLARIGQALRDLAWQCRNEADRQAVRGQLARLRDTAAGQDFDDTEDRWLADMTHSADAALRGRWVRDARQV